MTLSCFFFVGEGNLFLKGREELLVSGSRRICPPSFNAFDDASIASDAIVRSKLVESSLSYRAKSLPLWELFPPNSGWPGGARRAGGCCHREELLFCVKDDDASGLVLFRLESA